MSNIHCATKPLDTIVLVSYNFYVLDHSFRTYTP